MTASMAPTCFMFASEQDVRAAILPRSATTVVAPLGVREAAPDVFARHANEIGAGGEYIVCIHDASARSRAATAIRTVAMLSPRHPDLQLVITGEGGYEDDLRMQAAALGILHLVSFLGDRADELDVIRGATLGWVVAESDTAAYGILDCMSLGIPVLGGDGTVAERYILSEITGILVPPDDAYITAACVAGLISNETQRTIMGDAARARARREFTESQMVDGFERAADAVVRRR
jgi:glycosyltransferase involved in cell wall biosynthesis